MSSFAQAGAVQAANDEDTLETQEWLEALAAVLDREGPQRAHYLLERLIDEARRSGAHIPFSPNTAYVNTIPPGLEPAHPGNLELESRIRSYVRWNAMAMVVKANKHNPPDGGDLGGHIASFASLATMIGCGQNHFWHAETENHGGDLVYFQGHTSPGMYGRAYLEGRLTEDQLNHFRQEVDGKPVLVPASEADAGLLAVPDGVDGPGPADGHLPGALPEVPARPRHRRHQPPQGLGLLRRRRDGRAGIAGRHRPGCARSWTT